MMPAENRPKMRVVPFKELEQAVHYISIQDGEKNWVMRIARSIGKVARVEGKDGPDGMPYYNFVGQDTAILLTPEEYKTVTGRNAEP